MKVELPYRPEIKLPQAAERVVKPGAQKYGSHMTEGSSRIGDKGPFLRLDLTPLKIASAATIVDIQKRGMDLSTPYCPPPETIVKKC